LSFVAYVLQQQHDERESKNIRGGFNGEKFALIMKTTEHNLGKKTYLWKIYLRNDPTIMGLPEKYLLLCYRESANII